MIEDKAEKTESQKSEINKKVRESIRLIDDLKFFLATAPANWQENQVIRRYYLNHNEGYVSCVFWNNLYFITGTDIVRCIVYKFEQFGRKIIDRKKFEEGIFSDLRNLRCGTDAVLESPRSEFLEFLFKNSCLRTQKKQKVFFWFNVPHDRLMAWALERDLKKEKLGQKSTTVSHREPSKSFEYDEKKGIYNQLFQHIEHQKKILNMHGKFDGSSQEKVSSKNSTMHGNKEGSSEYNTLCSLNSNDSTMTTSYTNVFLNFDNVGSNDEESNYDLKEKNRSKPLEYDSSFGNKDEDFNEQSLSGNVNDDTYDNSNFELNYFNPEFDESELANEYDMSNPSFYQNNQYYDYYTKVENGGDPFYYYKHPYYQRLSDQVIQNSKYSIKQSNPIKTPMSKPHTSFYDQIPGKKFVPPGIDKNSLYYQSSYSPPNGQSERKKYHNKMQKIMYDNIQSQQPLCYHLYQNPQEVLTDQYLCSTQNEHYPCPQQMISSGMIYDYYDPVHKPSYIHYMDRPMTNDQSNLIPAVCGPSLDSFVSYPVNQPYLCMNNQDFLTPENNYQFYHYTKTNPKQPAISKHKLGGHHHSNSHNWKNYSKKHGDPNKKKKSFSNHNNRQSINKTNSKKPFKNL